MKTLSVLIFCLMLSSNIIAQTINVNGTVSDSNNEPLIGATIIEVGNPSNGTQTDIDGKFALKVSKNGSILVRYIGLDSQTIAINGRDNLTIKLQAKEETLDEVVVVGYGTQKKSSMTASVSTISSKEMQKQVNPNIASSLQGQTTGVEVLQKGGEAGADVKILVRGAGTFGETEPLYVIDGAFSNNGLSSINPADVESIEVLKDGSAAAIYGSRAANGVVLITTKQGKKGTPVVNIVGSYSLQTPSKMLNYMNASQWRDYANMVADNSTSYQRAPQNVNPSFPDRNTDWQDIYFQNASMHNLTASISGGNEVSSYNTSLGYIYQDGIIAPSNYKKYMARVNSTYKKGIFEFQENIALTHSKKRPQATARPMLIPTIAAQDANGRWVSTPGKEGYTIDGTDIVNPLAKLYSSEIYEKVTDITGGLSGTFKLFNGLKYKISASGSYSNYHNYNHTNAYASYWDENGDVSSLIDGSYQKYTSLDEMRGERFNYTIDNLLTYDKSFSLHNISALLGTSWNREFYRYNEINSDVNDLGNPTITTYNGPGTIGSKEMNTALLSFFTRVNYDYDGRYLLSASIRSDASSKFAKGNRVGYFPSVSAGWNIHQEKFFNVRWISKLKLRGGYGQLGANFISPYSFVSTAYGPVPAIFGINNNRQYGYVTYFAQESLKWEKSESSNIGIEVNFLKNTIKFTADFFNKKNVDLLAPLQSLPSAGQTIIINSGSLPYYNTASVQNRGWEFMLGYNKNWRDFRFDAQANVTFLKNKVLALGEGVEPIYGDLMSSKFTDRPTITKEGLPIGTFWGYKVTGINDQGNFIYEDIDNDGKPDKQVIGNPTPDFTFGLNFNLGYRDWDLTMFFQGSYGNDIFNASKYQNYFNYNTNTLVDAANSWRANNKNTNLPIAKSDNYTGGNSLPSTFYVEDGSYLRMKNLQLGYTVPAKISKKLLIQNARFYAGVQNLFTITHYSGYDPEVSANTLFDRGVDGLYQDAATVNARVYTFGFNLTF